MKMLFVRYYKEGNMDIADQGIVVLIYSQSKTVFLNSYLIYCIYLFSFELQKYSSLRRALVSL